LRGILYLLFYGMNERWDQDMHTGQGKRKKAFRVLNNGLDDGVVVRGKTLQ
jgi:hypothetical protein